VKMSVVSEKEPFKGAQAAAWGFDDCAMFIISLRKSHFSNPSMVEAIEESATA